MADTRPGRLSAVDVVCRYAGACAGTTAAMSSKIARAGVDGMANMGRWFRWSRPRRAPASGAPAEPPSARATVAENSPPEAAVGPTVSAEESDNGTVGDGSSDAASATDAAASELASQLEELQADNETLTTQLAAAQAQIEQLAVAEEASRAEAAAAIASELAATRNELLEAQREVEAAQSQLAARSATESTGPGSALDDSRGRTGVPTMIDNRGEEDDGPTVANEAEMDTETDVEAVSPASVSPEQVQATASLDGAKRIIFTRALDDLASEDVSARARAVWVMGGIRHVLAAGALVTHMARESSPQVRQECIKSLMTLGLKEGLPAIERALSDPVAAVRLAGVRGLYRMAGPAGGPALARMLSDEDDEVRRRTATCIGWLGLTEHAVALLPLLTDGNHSVRDAAAKAMGNLRSPDVVAELFERLNAPKKLNRKAVAERAGNDHRQGDE